MGGILGIFFGWLLGIAAGHFMGVTSVVSIESIIFAVGISCFIGIVFGVYPARKAARLDPIEALRYE
jgi:putative ABC transport system permease protein